MPARIAVIGDAAVLPGLAGDVELHVATTADVLHKLASQRFDLILLLQLAALAEATTIGMIASTHPRLPILAVSTTPTDARVVKAFKVGATGYLYTEDLATRCEDAIKEAILGGTPMSRAIAHLVLNRARRQTRPSEQQPRANTLTKQLSERQREILVELAVGSTYQEIARSLGVSLDTVRTHVRQIYERLGVTTKIEAVMAAIELGIIDRR